jgi:glycosyltransferase involved in cell wall biosynthesis
VLLVGAYVPTYGGIAIHVKRLKRKLVEKGVAVELATYPRSSGPAIGDHAEYRLWWPDIFKRTLRENYTLVHVHTAGAIEEYLSRFAAFRLSGAKLVVSFHSFRVSPAKSAWKDKLTLRSAPRRSDRPDWLTTQNTWRHRLAVRLLLKPIDHIICVSPAIRDVILTYGFPATKASVISSYLPPPLLEQDRSTIPPDVWQFMASHRPVLTAYAHRLNWFQGRDLYGLDMCVQLCQVLIKDYPELGIVFALPNIGDKTYFSETKARLKAMGLENAFFFSHAQAEYWPIIERSDLLLRPTNSDGFGMSVAEAIDLGTPAIASDVCPRASGTIMFRNRDFDDLLAKTQDVLSHLDEHKERLQGISASQSDSTSQILEVYKQVSTYRQTCCTC